MRARFSVGTWKFELVARHTYLGIGDLAPSSSQRSSPPGTVRARQHPRDSRTPVDVRAALPPPRESLLHGAKFICVKFGAVKHPHTLSICFNTLYFDNSKYDFFFFFFLNISH
eukprot:GHVR01052666.1.p2 GENE.GHVR01052666.1~~GHVR01052666.1.p2  ORF type:complete len:113 (+),score=0.59 GHVR01052666.1:818-1156(+)